MDVRTQFLQPHQIQRNIHHHYINVFTFEIVSFIDMKLIN